MTIGTEAEGRCAALALACAEPVAGTAPLAPRWACLEHRGSWPQDITRHPDPAVARFADRAAAAGFRLLLIRRHGRRSADLPARLYLADTRPAGTRPAGPALTALTVAGPSELTTLPLPGPQRPLPGTAAAGPLLLVCTHGRRDRCCALDGRALTAALAAAAEPDVWECSHLSGHRFAPTALVLPTGYLYGHLDLASAVAARKAAGTGEVETDRCRGRSTWSPAGQVAELAVRESIGLRDADAVTVYAETDYTVDVHTSTGRRFQVDIERAEIGACRPTSCGAAPTRLTPVRASGIRQNHAP